MSDDAGRLVAGRYRLVGLLGRGGMGAVWRARDELLEREVAVKEVWLPAGADGQEADPGFRRTVREARAAARLRHSSIVTVHDIVTDGGRPWIVMELIEGRSLAEVIGAGGPLSEREVAEIGLAVLSALSVAHARGITHRDVKPANVLLGDRPVLTDFGIAALDDGTAITGTNQLIGSPAYLAPERVAGQPASPATDLWSLGVTLYVAVSGRSPFERADIPATFAAVLTQEPDPLPQVPRLWPVIRGLLAKVAAERLTIDAAGRGLSELLAPVPTMSAAGRPRPLAYRFAAVGVAVLVVAAAIGVTVWRPPESVSGTPSPSTSTARALVLDGSPTFDTMRSRGGVIIGVRGDQPGLSYRDPGSGEYSGFEIEIATVIADAFGFPENKITFRPVPSSSREQSITGGEVDYHVGTYAITAARKEQVSFAGPYLIGGQDLLVRKDDTSITGKDSLTGKKVCAVTGSTSLQRVREQQLTEPSNIIGLAANPLCVDMLLANQIDAVTTDDTLLKSYASLDPGRLRVVGQPFSTEPYGIGLARDDKVFRDAVNDILQQALDDGTWQSIYDGTLGRSGAPARKPTIERY